MDMTLIPRGDASQLGRSLRSWRALRRVKQLHAAQLLGVSQATVSRWENGNGLPDEAEQLRLRQLLQARLDSTADRELARLVRQSSQAVHLVCDLTHRLLALSPAREAQCHVPASRLMGTSLWRYASEDIVAAEQRLGDWGWFGPLPPALEFHTRSRDSADLLIQASQMRWVRFQLSDGSYARLVETVALDDDALPGHAGSPPSHSAIASKDSNCR
ncbi:MAG: helix-turn-helix transcriptional regulator [Burkholderiales bacterium]|nr:helix-turn-helix transcriptional regulator [Burkholderiales bacterium]